MIKDNIFFFFSKATRKTLLYHRAQTMSVFFSQFSEGFIQRLGVPLNPLPQTLHPRIELLSVLQLVSLILAHEKLEHVTKVDRPGLTHLLVIVDCDLK